MKIEQQTQNWTQINFLAQKTHRLNLFCFCWSMFWGKKAHT